MSGKRKVTAALRAIAKHAGRVKSGKSNFSVKQHMDAIQALANFGLAMVGSNANMSREDGTKN